MGSWFRACRRQGKGLEFRGSGFGSLPARGEQVWGLEGGICCSCNSDQLPNTQNRWQRKAKCIKPVETADGQAGCPLSLIWMLQRTSTPPDRRVPKTTTSPCRPVACRHRVYQICMKMPQWCRSLPPKTFHVFRWNALQIIYVSRKRDRQNKPMVSLVPDHQ